MDDSSQEALALEKSGLLDLDDPKVAEKIDTYIEVSVVASDSFEEKLNAQTIGEVPPYQKMPIHF